MLSAVANWQLEQNSALHLKVFLGRPVQYMWLLFVYMLIDLDTFRPLEFLPLPKIITSDFILSDGPLMLTTFQLISQIYISSCEYWQCAQFPTSCLYYSSSLKFLLFNIFLLPFFQSSNPVSLSKMHVVKCIQQIFTASLLVMVYVQLIVNKISKQNILCSWMGVLVEETDINKHWLTLWVGGWRGRTLLEEVTKGISLKRWYFEQRCDWIEGESHEYLGKSECKGSKTKTCSIHF